MLLALRLGRGTDALVRRLGTGTMVVAGALTHAICAFALAIGPADGAILPVGTLATIALNGIEPVAKAVVLTGVLPDDAVGLVAMLQHVRVLTQVSSTLIAGWLRAIHVRPRWRACAPPRLTAAPRSPNCTSGGWRWAGCASRGPTRGSRRAGTM